MKIKKAHKGVTGKAIFPLMAEIGPIPALLLTQLDFWIDTEGKDGYFVSSAADICRRLSEFVSPETINEHLKTLQTRGLVMWVEVGLSRKFWLLGEGLKALKSVEIESENLCNLHRNSEELDRKSVKEHRKSVKLQRNSPLYKNKDLKQELEDQQQEAGVVVVEAPKPFLVDLEIKQSFDAYLAKWPLAAYPDATLEERKEKRLENLRSLAHFLHEAKETYPGQFGYLPRFINSVQHPETIENPHGLLWHELKQLSEQGTPGFLMAPPSGIQTPPPTPSPKPSGITGAEAGESAGRYIAPGVDPNRDPYDTPIARLLKADREARLAREAAVRK